MTVHVKRRESGREGWRACKVPPRHPTETVVPEEKVESWTLLASSSADRLSVAAFRTVWSQTSRLKKTRGLVVVVLVSAWWTWLILRPSEWYQQVWWAVTGWNRSRLGSRQLLYVWHGLKLTMHYSCFGFFFLMWSIWFRKLKCCSLVVKEAPETWRCSGSQQLSEDLCYSQYISKESQTLVDLSGSGNCVLPEDSRWRGLIGCIGFGWYSLPDGVSEWLQQLPGLWWRADWWRPGVWGTVAWISDCRFTAGEGDTWWCGAPPNLDSIKLGMWCLPGGRMDGGGGCGGGRGGGLCVLSVRG